MEKVLVIEDNETNLYLITYILQKHGFTVLQARTGEQGLEVADRETPDIILLDIQLPEMDGYAVARALRKNSALGKVPVIAVTSYSVAGDRERVLEAGCSGYIEKPIDPETFVADVVKFLRTGT